MNDFKVTKMKRLLIREFESADFDAIHSFAADPAVYRHMEWGPNTEADTHAFLERCREQRLESPRLFYERAIVLKETGQLIGSSGIRIRDVGHRNGDFGYTLDSRFWGKGYATEVARELVRFGFEDLKLHRIYATCRPENLASARVLEKCGLKLEGHLRENKFVRGVWVDSLLYALLEQDYANL